MSIPLIVVGAAGAALLFAGSKEKKDAGALPAVNATPTTQSTGGEGGGAQAPSHAGSEATNTVSETPASSFAGATVSADSVVNTLGGKPASSGGTTSPGQEFGADPWADASASATPTTTVNPHKVKTGADALGAVTQIGGVVGKAAAQSFQLAAESLGGLW